MQTLGVNNLHLFLCMVWKKIKMLKLNLETLIHL